MKTTSNLLFLLLLFFVFRISQTAKKHSNKKLKNGEDLVISKNEHQNKDSELLDFFSDPSTGESDSEGRHARKRASKVQNQEEFDELSELDGPTTLKSKSKKFKRSSDQEKLDPEVVIAESEALLKQEKEAQLFKRSGKKDVGTEESSNEEEHPDIFKPKKLDGFRLSSALSMGRMDDDERASSKKIIPSKNDEFPLDEDEKKDITNLKIKSLLEKEGLNKGPQKKSTHSEELPEPSFLNSENKIDEILNKHKKLALNPQEEDGEGVELNEEVDEENEEQEFDHDKPLKNVHLIEENEDDELKGENTIKKFKPLPLKLEEEAEEKPKIVPFKKPIESGLAERGPIKVKHLEEIIEEEPISEENTSDEKTIKKFKSLPAEEDEEEIEEVEEPKIKKFKPLTNNDDIIVKKEAKIKDEIVNLENKDSLLNNGDSDLDSLIQNHEESLKENMSKKKEDLFKPKLIKLEEENSQKEKLKKELKTEAETDASSEKPYSQDIMNDLLNFEAQSRNKALNGKTKEETEENSEPKKETKSQKEKPSSKAEAEKNIEDKKNEKKLVEKSTENDFDALNKKLKTFDASSIKEDTAKETTKGLDSSEAEILDFFRKQREKHAKTVEQIETNSVKSNNESSSSSAKEEIPKNLNSSLNLEIKNNLSNLDPVEPNLSNGTEQQMTFVQLESKSKSKSKIDIVDDESEVSSEDDVLALSKPKKTFEQEAYEAQEENVFNEIFNDAVKDKNDDLLLLSNKKSLVEESSENSLEIEDHIKDKKEKEEEKSKNKKLLDKFDDERKDKKGNESNGGKEKDKLDDVKHQKEKDNANRAKDEGLKEKLEKQRLEEDAVKINGQVERRISEENQLKRQREQDELARQQVEADRKAREEQAKKEEEQRDLLEKGKAIKEKEAKEKLDQERLAKEEKEKEDVLKMRKEEQQRENLAKELREKDAEQKEQEFRLQEEKDKLERLKKEAQQKAEEDRKREEKEKAEKMKKNNKTRDESSNNQKVSHENTGANENSHEKTEVNQDSHVKTEVNQDSNESTVVENSLIKNENKEEKENKKNETEESANSLVVEESKKAEENEEEQQQKEEQKKFDENAVHRKQLADETHEENTKKEKEEKDAQNAKKNKLLDYNNEGSDEESSKNQKIVYNNESSLVNGAGKDVVYVDSANSTNETNDSSNSNASCEDQKDPDLEKKLKEQISGKVQNRVKQIVSQYGIDCETNKTFVIQSLCSLCQGQAVYALNSDNWFKLGLAYNQRKVYSTLLDKVTTVLPASNFYIAFSDDAICLSSEKIYGNVSLSNLIIEFTNKKLSDWELANPIFKLDEHVRGNYFQVKFNMERDRQFYSDFIFSYKTLSQFQLNLDTFLTATNVKFFGETNEVSIDGFLIVNKTFQTAFSLNYTVSTEKQEWTTIKLIDREDKYSIEAFLFHFFGATASEQLVKNLQLSRGIRSLEKLHAKYIELKIMNPDNTTTNHPLTLIDLTINYIPNFAISPEFSLYNCIGNYMIFYDLDNKKFSWKLVLNCLCHGMEDFARTFIIKDDKDEKIFINSTFKNLTLSFVKDKIFQKGFEGKNLLGLFPDSDSGEALDHKLNFDNAILESFSTEIIFDPQQIYKVRGRIYLSDMDLRGTISVIVTNIGGKLTSFATFNFTKIKFHKFLMKLVNERVQNRLYDFSKIIKPSQVIIVTSNEDIDFKNFNLIKDQSILNETYWTKGVHLFYEFTIESECEDNLFCTYMNTIYGTNQTYYMMGDFSEKTKTINFKGALPDAVLVPPFNFSDVTLNLPLSFENENQINFEIMGKYDLFVEKNKSIDFQGNLTITDDNIVFRGQTSDVWKSAFDLTEMNLNQIYMKGTIDLITFHVLSFDITSLATIGTDCFLQNYNSEEIFQYDQCFYGNSDVKINYEDPSQNYLQGYFKNISIYSILINTMDFGTWNVFDNVTKHIFTMKFKEGAEISYAMKDIFEKDEGNQSLTILGGYTVKAEVSFIGLDGVVIINIDPAENELYGIFHFNTITFAGGNAMVFETDYTKSNNLLFKVNPELPPEDQLYFEGHVGIFGIREPVNITINNLEFFFKMSGQIFNSEHDFALELSAPYDENILHALWTVKTKFPEELLDVIENKLMNKTSEWIFYIKTILEKFDDKIKNLEELLINKKTELCDEELCPKAMECADEPKQKCLKYKEKHLCKEEEAYCLKPDQTCAQETRVCVSEQEICLLQSDELDADGKFQCLEKKTECLDYVTVCSEWKHVCPSETIVTCLEYEDVFDPNLCEKSQFVCKIVEIKDKTCVHECKSRLKLVEDYEEVYYGLIKAKENLDTKLMGFWTLYDEIIREPSSFIKVVFGKFEQKLDSIIEPNQLVMEIGIDSFSSLEEENQIDLIQIIDYDFKNHEYLINAIFLKLAQKWSLRFTYDPVILKENEGYLMAELYGHLKTKDPILTEIFSNQYEDSEEFEE